MNNRYIARSRRSSPVFAGVSFRCPIDPEIHEVVQPIQHPELLLGIPKIKVDSYIANLPSPCSRDDNIVDLTRRWSRIPILLLVNVTSLKELRGAAGIAK
jgi:hypothetical protein